jgi:hypothetical protein
LHRRFHLTLAILTRHKQGGYEQQIAADKPQISPDPAKTVVSG